MSFAVTYRMDAKEGQEGCQNTREVITGSEKEGERIVEGLKNRVTLD